MIKVSVFYPNSMGSHFDIDYYCNSHMPMVQARLGAALKGVEVEQGVGGSELESNPAYTAMGHLLFESVEAYQAAFGPHAAEIIADIPNYTDVEPFIQVSEIKNLK